MRRLSAFGAVAVACAACGAACSLGDASPVARYPWIEHARVALIGETLTIAVLDDAVEVDGSFRFDGDGTLPTQMEFPLGRGDGEVFELVAAMEPEGGAPIVLHTTPVEPSALPVDGAIDARTVDLPPGHEVRLTRLRVHYRQRVTRTFRYVLQSGAYWSGPIRALEVTVRDPSRRVDVALVEGRGPDRVEGDASRWTFVDLEPRGGVLIGVKPSR